MYCVEIMLENNAESQHVCYNLEIKITKNRQERMIHPLLVYEICHPNTIIYLILQYNAHFKCNYND